MPVNNVAPVDTASAIRQMQETTGQPSGATQDAATQDAIGEARKSIGLGYQQDLQDSITNNKQAPSLADADQELSQALLTNDPAKVSQALADETMAFAKDHGSESADSLVEHIQSVTGDAKTANSVMAQGANEAIAENVTEAGKLTKEDKVTVGDLVKGGETPAQKQAELDKAAASGGTPAANPTADADKGLIEAVKSGDAGKIGSAADTEWKAFAQQYPTATVKDFYDHRDYVLDQAGSSGDAAVDQASKQQAKDATDSAFAAIGEKAGPDAAMGDVLKCAQASETGK